MTPKQWSKVLDVSILVVGFGIPLFVILMLYVSLEETTSEMAIGIVGIFLLLGVFIGLIKWLKKRIRLRKDMNFKVSPYLILFSNTFGTVIGIILFTAFLNTVKGEIETLYKVMLIWCGCAVVAFALKFLQVHFELKIE